MVWEEWHGLVCNAINWVFPLTLWMHEVCAVSTDFKTLVTMAVVTAAAIVMSAHCLLEKSCKSYVDGNQCSVRLTLLHKMGLNSLEYKYRHSQVALWPLNKLSNWHCSPQRKYETNCGPFKKKNDACSTVICSLFCSTSRCHSVSVSRGRLMKWISNSGAANHCSFTIVSGFSFPLPWMTAI